MINASPPLFNTARVQQADQVGATPIIPDEDLLDAAISSPMVQTYENVFINLHGDNANTVDSDAGSYGSNETLPSEWQPNLPADQVAIPAQQIDNIPPPLQALDGDEPINPPSSDDEEEQAQGGARNAGGNHYYRNETSEEHIAIGFFFKSKLTRTEERHS